MAIITWISTHEFTVIAFLGRPTLCFWHPDSNILDLDISSIISLGYLDVFTIVVMLWDPAISRERLNLETSDLAQFFLKIYVLRKAVHTDA